MKLFFFGSNLPILLFPKSSANPMDEENSQEFPLNWTEMKNKEISKILFLPDLYCYVTFSHTDIPGFSDRIRLYYL